MDLRIWDAGALLIMPGKVFERLKQNPKWFAVGCVILFLTVVLVLLQVPFANRLALQEISGSLTKDEIAEVGQTLENARYLSALAAAAGMMAKWLLATAFLYAFSVILDVHDLQFRRLFATVVHGEIALVLMAVMNTLLLYLKGPTAVKSPTDLYVVPGLDHLVSHATANVPLFILLNGINPFAIWYIVIVSIGVSVMTGLRRVTSGIIVTLLWLAGLGFQFGVAAIGDSMRTAVGG